MCVLCRSPRTRMRPVSTVLSNVSAMTPNAQVVSAKASVGTVLGSSRAWPAAKGASLGWCADSAQPPANLFHAYKCPPKKTREPGPIPRNLLRWDEAPYPSSRKSACFGRMTYVHQTSTGVLTKQLKQRERRCRRAFEASACEADGLSLRGCESHRCRMSRVLSTRLLPWSTPRWTVRQ